MVRLYRQACLGPASGQTEHLSRPVPSPAGQLSAGDADVSPGELPVPNSVNRWLSTLHSYPGTRAAQALHQSSEH